MPQVPVRMPVRLLWIKSGTHGGWRNGGLCSRLRLPVPRAARRPCFQCHQRPDPCVHRRAAVPPLLAAGERFVRGGQRRRTAGPPDRLTSRCPPPRDADISPNLLEKTGPGEEAEAEEGMGGVGGPGGPEVFGGGKAPKIWSDLQLGRLR